MTTPRGERGPPLPNLKEGYVAIENKSYEAFANWLSYSEADKKRLNLPPNLTQYSLANGITDRTLRRWKNDPVLQAMVEKKLASKNRNQSAPQAVDFPEEQEDLAPKEDGGDSSDEYLAIKSTLIKGAMTGDPKYLDLYFKTYGKDFVAEEAAARTSDLAGLEMGELIIQALNALDINQILLYLQEIGYEVKKVDEAIGE